MMHRNNFANDLPTCIRAANIGWGFGVRNARAVRCQPIKSPQVPKKLMSGGGGGGGGGGLQHFFFPTSKIRHIVGVPFVHHKPLTSKKKKKKIGREILAYQRENVVKCARLTLNAWELAALHVCHGTCMRDVAHWYWKMALAPASNRGCYAHSLLYRIMGLTISSKPLKPEIIIILLRLYSWIQEVYDLLFLWQF